MNKCPKCSNGRVPAVFRTRGVITKKTEIECIYCDGKGTVSDEIFDEIIESDRDLWKKTHR